jgi:dimethylpropiothetin dethiomethylase
VSNLENRLAPLFKQIALSISKHDSTIATVASKSLLTACTHAASVPVSKSSCPVELKNLQTQTSSLALRELNKVVHTLPWSSSRTKAREHPGLDKLATVELLGPSGVVANDLIRIGLLYQPMSICYPSHRHAAEELYLVLRGTALWGQSRQPTMPLTPGSFSHHASWEWHEMMTQQESLLALYCWIGDLRFDQYEFIKPDTH